MKKTASLVFCAALIISLTGCETFGSKKKTSVPSTPVTTQYNCTDGTNFSITRNPKTPNSATLHRQGKTYQMTKVPTKTGADRLEHTSGITYIGVSNLSQLVNFKQGKNIASECRSTEQIKIQQELDAKKRKEAAIKAENAKKSTGTTKTIKKTKTSQKKSKK